MSLHAQLSPEAQARLAAQRRTSSVTSFIIAILLMVLMGLILWILAMNSNVKSIPQIVSYTGNPESNENLEQKKVQTQIQRKPSAPSSSMSKVIASNTASPTAVPVPEIDVPDPSTDFGDGNDFGDGWGNGSGTGAGGGFGNIPANMKQRCSHEDRMARLKASGGTEAVEDAVIKSLDWLKEKQNKDGSWPGNKTAMTGLALLCYLGHCETAQSEKYGETVLAAIAFLVDKSMKNNGKLADDFKNNHWPYEHAIATYALAEAYTLCVKSFGENINQLEEAVMASGQFLINSQHKGGGWDYAYSEDSARGGDTSIVGWHLQALKACNYTGLDFKNMRQCYRKGLDYLETKQAASGAFGYSSPNPRPEGGSTLTGVCVLCFQIWQGSANRQARSGIRYIDKEVKFKWDSADSDLYGHYYIVQAMLNHGGKEWERYNELFREEVLNAQEKEGSYKTVNNGQKDINGVAASFVSDTVYRTCLATLMLESYYRFLPASEQVK